MTVADLTAEHFGWLITITDSALYSGSRRTVTLTGLRRWENDDGPQVGVVTDEGRDRGWAGTERMFPAGTPCEPLRPVTAKAKRAAKQAAA